MKREKKVELSLYFILCEALKHKMLCSRDRVKIRENDYLFPTLPLFFVPLFIPPSSSPSLYYHTPASSFYSPAVSFVLLTTLFVRLIVCQVHRWTFLENVVNLMIQLSNRSNTYFSFCLPLFLSFSFCTCWHFFLLDWTSGSL